MLYRYTKNKKWEKKYTDTAKRNIHLLGRNGSTIKPGVGEAGAELGLLAAESTSIHSPSTVEDYCGLPISGEHSFERANHAKIF